MQTQVWVVYKQSALLKCVNLEAMLYVTSQQTMVTVMT